MRYKLTIAYDGTNYCGWQVQENALSIQSLVQNALKIVLRHPLDLTGASRTDAGVHAYGQVAHFDTEEPINLGRLRISLNALLPPDIRIFDVTPVPTEFHSRYSARSKIYHYHLHTDPVSDPFTRLYCHQVFGSFDLAKLKEGAKLFLGTHDFTSFANVKQIPTSDAIRTIKRLDIIDQKGGIRLEFEGDGFLYKMVRNITGMLLDIAAGKAEPNEIETILSYRDRRKAGSSAPALGLFLVKIIY